VADILVGALALGLVVFFQLGLPILQAKARSRARQAEREQQTQTEQVVSPAQAQAEAQAAPTAEPGGDTPEAPADATPAPEGGIVGDLTGTTPTPVPTEDPRTEWQIRFAEHFTDEVVITDHSYTSPQVSITIETREFDAGNGKSVYHVADIYVASLDNFRTYTANNELEFWSTQDAMEMDADSHAILTISGDFYSYQPKGFLVRNGELYMSDQTWCDLCVLYDSGVMACYGRDEYTVEDVWNRGVAQAWNFGPSLLDENGHVKPDYELSEAVSFPNPRSAVGYYEPGHYCFVVVDGRQDGYSKGMTVPELAQVFEDLGCTCAYNLDGGGSALMTFLHQRYSRQSNGAGRELGDMLIVTEEGWEDKR
jgi:exopolysaccharide biosynthesis protein